MRHLKKFNELKSSTYGSASKKLGDLGHTRRSAELRKWSDATYEKEKLKEINARRIMYSKHGSYNLIIDGKPGNFFLIYMLIHTI
jgi:hypothetical protein